LAKVFLEIFAIPKRPSVTCFGYQSPFKKTSFDIQRLKLVIAKLHSTKTGKTYNYLVFSTNICCENYFLEQKKILDTNVNISISFIDFPQIAWANDF
jgi:hypothetical protein